MSKRNAYDRATNVTLGFVFVMTVVGFTGILDFMTRTNALILTAAGVGFALLFDLVSVLIREQALIEQAAQEREERLRGQFEGEKNLLKSVMSVSRGAVRHWFGKELNQAVLDYIEFLMTHRAREIASLEYHRVTLNTENLDTILFTRGWKDEHPYNPSDKEAKHAVSLTVRAKLEQISRDKIEELTSYQHFYSGVLEKMGVTLTAKLWYEYLGITERVQLCSEGIL